MAGPSPDAPPEATLLKPSLVFAALIYALIELGFGIVFSVSTNWQRAEPTLFFITRPWLLVVVAALAAGQETRHRIALYAAALLLAGASETGLAIGVGSTNPWPEMLRALLAGAAVAAFADLVIQIARRSGGRLAGWLFAGAVLLLFALSPVLRLYDRAVIGPTGALPPSADKPELVLMTSLPIIWGENGAFGPDSRPSITYQLLADHFAIRPIDAATPQTLGRSRLMLLAQPRALAPEELVAIDAWVRGGGKALILTDPQLVWPSRLPLGDPRRPPPVGLLAPLLNHWGIGMERQPSRHEGPLDAPGRLALLHPGKLTRTPPSCTQRGWFLARCPIGAGEVIVIPDADLLHDSTWTGQGPRGWERHLRRADNPSVVAALLDSLAGLSRPPILRPVQWNTARSPRDVGSVFWLTAAPLLAAFFAWLLLLVLRRRRPGTNILIHRDVLLERDKNGAENGP